MKQMQTCNKYTKKVTAVTNNYLTRMKERSNINLMADKEKEYNAMQSRRDSWKEKLQSASYSR